MAASFNSTLDLTDTEIGELTARHFGSSPFLQGYVKGKIRADPAYSAVFDTVSKCPGSIVDLGCGLGLLTHYLRARGVANHVTGVEPDAEKLGQARQAAERGNLAKVAWWVGSAETNFPTADYYVLLDILHYMAFADQAKLLAELATRAAAGATVLIRNGVRDRSWRYSLTYMEELWVRTSRWIPVRAPICFPTIASIQLPFRENGVTCASKPLWGHTPFNSYWFEFCKTPRP